MTASKRPFDKTTPILRIVNKNNKLNTPYFSKSKAKTLFLLTTAVLDIYTFLPPVSAYLFIFPHQPDIGMFADFFRLFLAFIPIIMVSVSAMLVDTRQKNIAQVFILERYFFVSICPAVIPGTCLSVFLAAVLLLC